MVFKQTTCACVLLAFLLLAAQEKFAHTQTIKIEDGFILGRKSQTIRNNMSYYSFEGIPYAQPPVGNLRFQPPVPNNKWENTLNATHLQNICVQENTNNSFSEDCLYINVYTPSLTKKNLPVMVWIFGGGFFMGSGNIIPDYILEQKDIILVSFNYRVGLFGFISTGDLVLPGNAGLKDQVLALKWVQRNIAHFGGNPQNVTIFGESAGAASVSYLQQSNLTKGLFQQAIMESGSSLCLWALTRKAREVAFFVGRSLGIFASNSQNLLNGLLKVDANTLLNKGKFNSILNGVITNPLNGMGIGPVREPEHEGALFTGLSHQLLSQGNYHKVPTIVGHNSQESLGEFPLPPILKKYLTNPNLVYADLIPIDMNVSNLLRKTYVGTEIRHHYFGNLPIDLQNNNTVQFMSDDQFNRPTSEYVRLLSKNAPTYYYVFSYKGLMGSPNRSELGVGHGEEIPYLLSPPLNKPTTFDIVVSNRLCKLWANFAKYGNPTPQEDPILQNISWYSSNVLNSEDLVYLDIGSKFSLRVNPNKENIVFYKNLYNRYGVPPYDTY